MAFNWTNQVDFSSVTNIDYGDNASYLYFGAVGALPDIRIPLYIIEHSIPVRKARIGEVNTITIADPQGWDSGFGAIFVGAPDALQVQVSGFMITPTTQVTDGAGLKYDIWSPTIDGNKGSTSLNLDNWSYGDIISGQIEGRFNQVHNRLVRNDPAYYVDPFGHRYNNPLIFEFTCQNQRPSFKQSFSLTMVLGD